MVQSQDNSYRNKRINCHRCIYFYITWESHMPYGCRAMGFKSRQLPSIVVFNSSGEPCLRFSEKQNRSK
ncbi:MAG: uracil-DNA glycosylase [Desulfobacteraceae bacterium]|nr:MAG: uracil-DNA glycosylase [Desulfobacteraceae bacterium]